jgi:hypothetical protein
MRTILAAAAFAALGAVFAPAAHGQAGATAPAAANPKLAGNWEGNYTTDGPSGTMAVGLTKGATWTVTCSMTGDVPPAAEPRELAFDGDKVSWKQAIGEYEVTFKAQISADGAQLTGTIEATQGGSYVGGGTFTLTRKA